MLFFRLSTWVLALLLFVVVFGAVMVGFLVGRSLQDRSQHLRDPIGLLQTALLGLVALILAFSLSLAVGRHEARRAAVVEDSNAIGTAYLRAQLLEEPFRTRSLDLLRRYTDVSLTLSETVPGSHASLAAIHKGEALQRELWAIGGEVMDGAPNLNPPRLFVESLNQVIDMQTVRIAALNNRVPTPVLALEVGGAAFAVGLIAFLLAMLGRGLSTAIVAATLVTFLLVVTFDLDRPTRGFIRVPEAPLVQLRASMEKPPAASAPAVGR
jgi:hypothetical protein